MTQSYPSFVALNCLFVSDTRNVPFFFFAAPKCTFKKSCSCTAFQRFVQQKFCITLPHFSWTWNFLIDSPAHLNLLPSISLHWSYHCHFWPSNCQIQCLLYFHFTYYLPAIGRMNNFLLLKCIFICLLCQYLLFSFYFWLSYSVLFPASPLIIFGY